MKFRKASKLDMDKIMDIIKQAQDYFKSQGIDQWQNNYPNVEVIGNDIDNDSSYVLLKDNNIVATTAVTFDKEASYDIIYEGKWLSNDEYAVIHRVAVDNKYKGSGISSEIIKQVEKLCLSKGVYSIKVDTNEDNIPMQKLLKKNKFEYCGIVYIEDGSKKVAFEKIL